MIDPEIIQDWYNGKVDDEELRYKIEQSFRFVPKAGTFIKHKSTGAIWFVGLNRMVHLIKSSYTNEGETVRIHVLDGGAGHTDGSLPLIKWQEVTATFA